MIAKATHERDNSYQIRTNHVLKTLELSSLPAEIRGKTRKVEGHLRATDSKYGESNDSSENSDFLLLRQKDTFGQLFSGIYFKSSSELTFF